MHRHRDVGAFRVGERELSTTPSIGISLYPRDGIEADHLIRNADAAMYQAKGRGRNTFQFYSSDMNDRAAERLELEVQLRTAHLRGELCLHYQPQVDAISGRIVGAEALMRWQHPGVRDDLAGDASSRSPRKAG